MTGLFLFMCNNVSIAQCADYLEHLYRIYSIPTHDKQQWLLLQFLMLLMMDAKGVRNMQSIPVVVNKHNTARVASCLFIICYSTKKSFGSKSNIKVEDKSFFGMSDRFDWSVVLSRHGVTFTSRYAFMHKKACLLKSGAVETCISPY